VSRIVLFPMFLLALLLGAACQDAAEVEPERSTTGAMSAAGMDISADTLGLAPLVDLGGPAMDELRVHLDTVQGLSGDRLASVRERHGELIRAMMVRMTAEMNRLTMGGSGDWEDMMAAVRQDWELLPAIGIEELEEMLPEHVARVRRLMDLHRERMAEMHMG
jgi:hypothetical protein